MKIYTHKRVQPCTCGTTSALQICLGGGGGKIFCHLKSVRLMLSTYNTLSERTNKVGVGSYDTKIPPSWCTTVQYSTNTHNAIRDIWEMVNLDGSLKSRFVV